MVLKISWYKQRLGWANKNEGGRYKIEVRGNTNTNTKTKTKTKTNTKMINYKKEITRNIPK
jgi:hypothetical protein